MVTVNSSQYNYKYGKQIHSPYSVAMLYAYIKSKEELTRSDVPYITIKGRRGGSSAAAATVNALLTLALEGNKPETGETEKA